MTADGARIRDRLPDILHSLLFGTDDPRLRATWRILLSWALLIGWALTTLAVTGALTPVIETTPPPAQIILTITLGTTIFLALFLVFPRYIDRRPLADYGFSLSRTWVAELGVGFAAMFGGTALWHAIGLGLGWTTIDVALTGPSPTTLVWLLALLVPWYFSGLTQSLLSLALVIKNGAEGLHARGHTLTHAVTGALAVAILFFILRHDPTNATAILHETVGGAVFALLYIHSGNLALSIGAIGGANYVNSFIFANPANPASPLAVDLNVLDVTHSLPAIVDFLANINLPAMVFTYVLALGWLTWQRDGATIHPSLTQWTPRDD